MLMIFTDCGFDVLKRYVHKVEELCVGPSTPSTGSSAVGKKGDKKGLFGIGRILSERELSSSRKSSMPPAAPGNSNHPSTSQGT